jgi:hypothetical protein
MITKSQLNNDDDDDDDEEDDDNNNYMQIHYYVSSRFYEISYERRQASINVTQPVLQR